MKGFVVFMTVVAFLFLPTMMVWAQTQPAQPIQFKNLDAPLPKVQPSRVIKHPPVAAKLNTATIKINKLQPIAFKPFTLQELRHPETIQLKDGRTLRPARPRQPITPTEIITLKSGKTITGQQLLDEINKLEKMYNEWGYSLRRPVKTPIVINETIMKRDLLQRQRQDSKLKYRPLVPVKAPKFANMQTIHAQRLQQMPTVVENLNQIQPSLSEAIPQPINKEERYDDYWGDRDYFAAGLHGRVKFYADKDKMQASAEGKATAVVFNHEWTVVSINGGAEGPTANPDGQMHAYLKMTALGIDLYQTPINMSGKGSLPIIERDQSIGVEKSVEIPIVYLGPFSINVRLGFIGAAGVRCGIYLTPGSLQAKFMPYLETSAYGEAGLNIWVFVDIEAGVGARLTLLNDYLVLSAIAGIGFDQSQPYFFYEYYARNTIETLSGEIYAYVTIDYYFDSDTWKWTIFSWDGFRHDGYVIGPVVYNKALPPPVEAGIWDVTVYEHQNYAGKYKTFNVYPTRCQTMDFRISESGWNDRISSIKVGKNVAVMLFEHQVYTGTHIRFEESVPDLRKYNFNDKVSSLIVFPKAMGHPMGVWLIGNKTQFIPVFDFSQRDWYGCSCKDETAPYAELIINDDAIKVVFPKINPQPPEWGHLDVTLYEHKDFKGSSIRYQAGPSGGEFILPKELQKKVSSASITLKVHDPKRLQRPW